MILSVTTTVKMKKDKNSERPRYNTRSITKKKEENNNLSNNPNNDSSDVESEIHQIEEIFNINDSKYKPNGVSTEIYVQGAEKSNENLNQLLLSLLDTGATGIFIKRTALNNILHHIKKTNIHVKGRYAQSQIHEVALLNIKLPDFYNSCTVTVEAYVEEESIGRHDIILGVRFIQQLDLIIDFKRNTVIWDEITIPMRQMGSIKANELTSIDKHDSDLHLCKKL
jgi:hypothetical protein